MLLVKIKEEKWAAESSSRDLRSYDQIGSRSVVSTGKEKEQRNFAYSD
jgi:hypothetical protein